MLNIHRFYRMSSFKKEESLSKLCEKIEYPVCPVCYSRHSMKNPVSFHKDTGFFSCLLCDNVIKRFIPFSEFIIGTCCITSFNVGAPFSLLCRKPYYGLKTRPSFLSVAPDYEKWISPEPKNPSDFYVDSGNEGWVDGDFLKPDVYLCSFYSSSFRNQTDSIETTYTKMRGFEKIWTFNLPVYFNMDPNMFLVGPLVGTPSEHFSYGGADTPEGSSEYFSLGDHLVFDKNMHQFVMDMGPIYCPSCKGSKLYDVNFHRSYNTIVKEYGFQFNLQDDSYLRSISSKDSIYSLYHNRLGLSGSQSFMYNRTRYTRCVPENSDDTSELYRFTLDSSSFVVFYNPVFSKGFCHRGGVNNEPISHIVDVNDLHDKSLCGICQKSRKSSKLSVKKRCISCGDLFWEDDAKIGICKTCHSSILAHDFDVMSVLRPKRLGLKKIHSIPLGVELEIYTKHGNLENIKDFISENDSNFLFKWDGSINMGEGFEIVSAPLLYGDHIRTKGWKFVFSPESYLEEDSRCGMHVHVPITAFPSPFLTSKQRFSYAVYTQYSKDRLSYLHRCMYSDKNLSFIKNISGRNPSNPYAPFDGIHYRDGSKYTGLNFNTKSGKTAEFRIFKSPTSFERFLVNLQFVDAFTSFFRGMSDKSDQVDWSKESESFFRNGFYDFIVENNKHYDMLEKYLPSYELEVKDTEDPKDPVQSIPTSSPTNTSVYGSIYGSGSVFTMHITGSSDTNMEPSQSEEFPSF